MKLALIALLFVTACDTSTPPSTRDDCREFPYKTTRAGKEEVCQMLWCNKGGGDWHQGSGMATLWCDPIAPETTTAR
jgi:hypothetical protein